MRRAIWIVVLVVHSLYLGVTPAKIPKKDAVLELSRQLSDSKFRPTREDKPVDFKIDQPIQLAKLQPHYVSKTAPAQMKDRLQDEYDIRCEDDSGYSGRSPHYDHMYGDYHLLGSKDRADKHNGKAQNRMGRPTIPLFRARMQAYVDGDARDVAGNERSFLGNIHGYYHGRPEFAHHGDGHFRFREPEQAVKANNHLHGVNMPDHGNIHKMHQNAQMDGHPFDKMRERPLDRIHGRQFDQMQGNTRFREMQGNSFGQMNGPGFRQMQVDSFGQIQRNPFGQGDPFGQTRDIPFTQMQGSSLGQMRGNPIEQMQDLSNNQRNPIRNNQGHPHSEGQANSQRHQAQGSFAGQHQDQPRGLQNDHIHFDAHKQNIGSGYDANQERHQGQGNSPRQHHGNPHGYHKEQSQDQQEQMKSNNQNQFGDYSKKPEVHNQGHAQEHSQGYGAMPERHQGLENAGGSQLQGHQQGYHKERSQDQQGQMKSNNQNQFGEYSKRPEFHNQGHAQEHSQGYGAMPERHQGQENAGGSQPQGHQQGYRNEHGQDQHGQMKSNYQNQLNDYMKKPEEVQNQGHINSHKQNIVSGFNDRRPSDFTNDHFVVVPKSKVPDELKKFLSNALERDYKHIIGHSTDTNPQTGTKYDPLSNALFVVEKDDLRLKKPSFKLSKSSFIKHIDQENTFKIDKPFKEPPKSNFQNNDGYGGEHHGANVDVSPAVHGGETKQHTSMSYEDKNRGADGYPSIGITSQKSYGNSQVHSTASEVSVSPDQAPSNLYGANGYGGVAHHGTNDDMRPEGQHKYGSHETGTAQNKGPELKKGHNVIEQIKTNEKEHVEKSKNIGYDEKNGAAGGYSKAGSIDASQDGITTQNAYGKAPAYSSDASVSHKKENSSPYSANGYGGHYEINAAVKPEVHGGATKQHNYGSSESDFAQKEVPSLKKEQNANEQIKTNEKEHVEKSKDISYDDKYRAAGGYSNNGIVDARITSQNAYGNAPAYSSDASVSPKKENSSPYSANGYGGHYETNFAVKPEVHGGATKQHNYGSSESDFAQKEVPSLKKEQNANDQKKANEKEHVEISKDISYEDRNRAASGYSNTGTIDAGKDGITSQNTYGNAYGNAPAYSPKVFMSPNHAYSSPYSANIYSDGDKGAQNEQRAPIVDGKESDSKKVHEENKNSNTPITKYVTPMETSLSDGYQYEQINKNGKAYVSVAMKGPKVNYSYEYAI